MRSHQLSINKDVSNDWFATKNEVVLINNTASLNKVFSLNGTASLLTEATSLYKLFSLYEAGLLDRAASSSKVFTLI